MSQLPLSLQHLSLLHIGIIMCLTALTALASHLARASFNDGIRPIIPEVIEGRMKRSELASVSFGLSIGFIVSLGLSFTVSFQMLNPWILFLPTDILGVMAVNWSMAIGLGAIWGVLAIVVFSGAHTWFAAFPVDFLGAINELSTPVLLAFAVAPIIAILSQFGRKHALFSGIALLVIYVLLPEFGSGYLMKIMVLMVLGMIFILFFALKKDIRYNRIHLESIGSDDSAMEDEEAQSQSIRRHLFKGLPLLASIGGLAAAACNLGLFTGSDMAAPILNQAWSSTGQERNDLLWNAALTDIMRGFSYLPLLATTAWVTGVSSLLGLTLIYPIGYLSPNPIVAGVLGVLCICLEVAAVRRIVRLFEKFPTLRESADHIRSAMTTMLELALFIGGILAVMNMNTSAYGMPLMIYMLLYAANEGMARPVIRMAAGPVAAIMTGILMSLFYFLQFN